MNDDTEKVAAGVIMSNLDNDVETKLEGARAKIKLLEKELKIQDERTNKLIIAVRSICVAIEGLPKNRHACSGAVFSRDGCVEEIEKILSNINADYLDWAPASRNQKKKRGNTNAEITSKIRTEQGHRLVDDSNVSADSAHARERGAQAGETFFLR